MRKTIATTTRANWRRGGALALVAGLSLLSGSASAASTSFTSPWGDDEESIGLLGSEASGQTWLVWFRMTTGECQKVSLGASGLAQDTRVIGTSKSNILGSVGSFGVQCGVNIGPPIINGHMLVFDGAAGDDVVMASVPAVGVIGGGGDDLLMAAGPGVMVVGAAGNDDVETWGPASDEFLLGDGVFFGGPIPTEDVDDCVFDESHTVQAAACGPGTNSVVLPLDGEVGGCTEPVSCCPLGAFYGLCSF